jgi:hypothetical protein
VCGRRKWKDLNGKGRRWWKRKKIESIFDKIAHLL